MDNLNTLVGTKIRSIRLRYGLTQEDFCERIGIEIPTLSKIENGRALPSLNTIIKILKEFQIEPNDLLGFINQKNRVNDIDIEINERIKILPDDLKQSLLKIIENLGK